MTFLICQLQNYFDKNVNKLIFPYLSEMCFASFDIMSRYVQGFRLMRMKHGY